MGIVSRLEELLKSYINGGEQHPSDHSSGGGFHSGDPDLQAAYEELNDYLGTDKQHTNSENSSRTKKEAFGQKPGQSPAPPEDLRPDYTELGVPFGASLDVCKAAYKQLLKLHHPDRHAGHPANMKKATEKSARINAAWDRIEKWSKDT